MFFVEMTEIHWEKGHRYEQAFQVRLLGSTQRIMQHETHSALFRVRCNTGVSRIEGAKQKGARASLLYPPDRFVFSRKHCGEIAVRGAVDAKHLQSRSTMEHNCGGRPDS